MMHILLLNGKKRLGIFLKSEEPLEDAINLCCQAGRAVWQSEAWLDAKMWSVTFLTVTLDEMDGFWNTSQEAATLMWSSVGLSAQLWLAVSEVVGFCQPFRYCIASLQMQLVWHHLQDPALVLALWAIVSWEINGHSHILPVLIELFSHVLMCQLPWTEFSLTYSVLDMHINGRNPGTCCQNPDRLLLSKWEQLVFEEIIFPEINVQDSCFQE